MADNKEMRRVYFLPQNFSGGVNLVGFNMDIRNLIEGSLLAVLVLAIDWKFANFFSGLPQKASFMLITGACAFALGFNGYRGDPFSTALANMIKFNKEKRICYYNNRPKIEAKPKSLKKLTGETEIFGRKQAQELIAKYKAKSSSFNEDERPDTLFFEEDIGIVNMPDNYIGAKKEAKERKKRDEKKRKQAARKRKKKKV